MFLCICLLYLTKILATHSFCEIELALPLEKLSCFPESQHSCLDATAKSIVETRSSLTTNIIRNCNSQPEQLESYEKNSAGSSVTSFNLTDISIGDWNYLVLKWSFSISFQGKVQIEVKGSNGIRKSCSIYDLRHQQTTAFSGYLTDRCLLKVTRGETYTLTVAVPGSDFIYNSYQIFTPTSLQSNIADGDVSNEWNLVIAVSNDRDSLSIFIQPLPDSSLNSYALRLVRQIGDTNVQLEQAVDQFIKPGEKVLRFINVKANGYVIYLLKCSSRFSCNQVLQTYHYSPFINTQLTPPDSVMEKPVSTDKVEEVVKESGSGIQKNDLIILLGTVFGVGFVVAIVGLILFIYFKRRHTLPSHSNNHRLSADVFYSDIALYNSDEKLNSHIVLLLYSYDCQAHMSCIQSLALLLQNVLGCVVLTDFWATQEISEVGLMVWMQRKLAVVNSVLIICSAGVRFKCAAHRRAQLHSEENDMLLLALDLLQSSKANYDIIQKVVLYFDYSNECDIPPLLENWQQYKVPIELETFLSHFTMPVYKDWSLDKKGKREQGYINDLNKKINEVKKYMSQHPDWFHSNLDSAQIEHFGASSTTHQYSALHKPLDIVTVEHSGSFVSVNKQETENNSDLSLNGITHLNRQKTTVRTESMKSSASSFEDMQYSVDFILKPTSIRDKYLTSPRLLLDMLPYDSFTNSPFYTLEVVKPVCPSLSSSSSSSSVSKSSLESSELGPSMEPRDKVSHKDEEFSSHEHL